MTLSSPSRTAWNRLGVYLRRRRGGWLLGAVAIFVTTLALMLVIYLITPLIATAESVSEGHLAPAAALQTIAIYVGYMVGLTVLGNVLLYFATAFMVKLAQNTLVELRADYQASLLHQHPGFFRDNEVGELVSVGINDADVVGTFLTEEVPNLLNYASQLVLAIGFMLSLRWELALVSMGLVTAIHWLGLRFIVPQLRHLAERYSHQLAALNGRLGEELTGARDIQLFGQTDRMQHRFQQALRGLAHTVTRSLSLSAANSSLFYGISGLGLTLIYGFGAVGHTLNWLDVALVVSFAKFLEQFMSPLKALSNVLVKVQRMLISAGRLFAFVDAPLAIKDKPDAKDPGALTGHIRFENVAFTYLPDDPNAWRVRGINLEIKPGEKVAFVGGSGSGKSTILNLVPRFYDVTGGRVTIDGHDVRDLPLEALRRHCGLVAQNVILFEGTLADNIRFARPEADLTAVKAAAEVGYVTEFVDKLDHGYDTHLGAMGQGLSGGQKQRVSIARAALPNPSILLLDEATSALDTKSEAAVMQALDRLMEGRTTLIIAHRLNTIRNADKIVVMGTDPFGYGEVKAIGTHDQLLDTSPDYVALLGKSRRKGIVMPIGPQYDTTPALPTVIGLAQAFNAPVYLLDFGPLASTTDAKHFGVTVIPSGNTMSVNIKHALRVKHIAQTVRGEGLQLEVITPPNLEQDWIENTLLVIDQTEASHLVATDNVMIPMEKLRENIQKIQRKSAVEYVLVNPITVVE